MSQNMLGKQRGSTVGSTPTAKQVCEQAAAWKALIAAAEQQYRAFA